jgi:hypothetical protein
MPAVRGRVLRRLAVVLGWVLVVGGCVWRASTLEWPRYTKSALTQEVTIAALLVVTGLVIIAVLWKLPLLQVVYSEGLTPENRFDRENEARKTLAQILGGILLLAGIYSSEQNLATVKEGQITDRFTKAIEQLGAVKLEVRLGAIYALERIARDSERDHWPILEVLTAYVRENAPRNGPEQSAEKVPEEEPLNAPHLRADIQAILTVLGRREMKYDEGRHLDLRGANLRRANLYEANLIMADLNGADLREADLFRANLREAALRGANLSGANLVMADLSRADLYQTVFVGANLSGVHFNRAHLIEADLSRSKLFETILIDAELGGVKLFEADLTATDLSGAHNLWQSRINEAHGSERTQLPAGLQKPAGWLRAR